MFGCFEHGVESSVSMKCRDYLDWLRKQQVLKKVSAVWNLGEIHSLKKNIEFVLQLRVGSLGIGIVFPAATEIFHPKTSRPVLGPHSLLYFGHRKLFRRLMWPPREVEPHFHGVSTLRICVMLYFQSRICL